MNSDSAREHEDGFIVYKPMQFFSSVLSSIFCGSMGLDSCSRVFGTSPGVQIRFYGRQWARAAQRESMVGGKGLGRALSKELRPMLALPLRE